MRCSSCKPLLDRYAEGTLARHEMASVAAHLRSCGECSALLDELKVVDALLLTSRAADLQPNFTFAVMAEIQALPAPRAREHAVWGFLVLYSAAVWMATVIGMVVTGTSPAAAIAFTAALLARAGIAGNAFAAGVTPAFTHTLPGLAAFGFAVFVVDLAIAAAFAFIYFVLRPRLAAQLVSVPEVP
ncbi:MAG TPA: zf-HC2 domain-containing protein [Candidatus Baltobacteraceae bacterium]|jgi:predicted anti-sigma-YlaC factor YlaD|nr:zf-HC2 domain-containing protein [Candidatus Baltobacteraceae bacterium]